VRKYLWLILILLLPQLALASGLPKREALFNDYAKLLSSVEEEQLEQQLNTLWKETGATMVVVTIPSLGDRTIEEYAVDLFQAWGIGTKEEERGLLFLIAPNEREMRIEVGYGLEGEIPDAFAGKLISQIGGPAFKQGAYAQGIREIIRQVSIRLGGTASQEKPKSPVDWWEVIFWLIVIILIISSWPRKGKGTKSKSGFPPFWIGGGPRSGGGGSSGSSGFGGGGGGFSGGSFGGGGSGGGGASGKW
jgi:uncharacterized protein